jgi:protein-disulfide isomerase
MRFGSKTHPAVCALVVGALALLVRPAAGQEQKQTAPKAKPAAAPAVPSAAKTADPRMQALVAWMEGFFPYGAGELTVEDVTQLKVPGYRLVRAVKTYGSDPRANDQAYAALDDDGKTAVMGDLLADEDRMKSPAPVKTDADLAGVRKSLTRYFRGAFKVLLDPKLDRHGWKGVTIRTDTGYGNYDIGGFLSANDGSFIILGRVWDRGRSFADQRRELIRLADTPSTGPPDAKITVVEYSDMQCGYCKKRTGDWDRLLEKMGSLLKIRRYIKSFPLTSEHPWAFRASSAGRCFFDVKPELFFSWKAQVYAKQEVMSVEALDSFALDFAAANEINEDLFKGCYLQPKCSSKILADLSEGFGLRVRSTPTYFIDGVAVSWFSDNIMEEFLRKTYLKGAGLPLPTPIPSPSLSGVPPGPARTPTR